MKQQKWMIGLSAAVAALLALPAAAEGVMDKVEVYGKAGLSGLGVGAGYGISEKLTVRSDVSTLGFNRSFDEDDVHYKAKLKNHKINLYGDYFPANNGFRLTAGLGLGKTELSATGHARRISQQEFKIGDKKYDVTLDGNDTVKASVKYPTVSPYFGIGWGHNVGQKKTGWGFNADLGLSLGSPKTKLSVNSSLNEKLVKAQAEIDGVAGATLTDEQKAAAQAEIDSRIAAEQKKIKDRIGKYKVIPMISVGVSYRF